MFMFALTCSRRRSFARLIWLTSASFLFVIARTNKSHPPIIQGFHSWLETSVIVIPSLFHMLPMDNAVCYSHGISHCLDCLFSSVSSQESNGSVSQSESISDQRLGVHISILSFIHSVTDTDDKSTVEYNRRPLVNEHGCHRSTICY